MSKPRQSIQRFANAMENTMQKNNHKSGWTSESVEWLLNRLRQESDELLKTIIRKESVVRIREECTDVGNFAMMIYKNIGVTK